MALLLIEGFEGFGRTTATNPSSSLSNKWALGAANTSYTLRDGRNVGGISLEPAAISSLNTISKDLGDHQTMVCGFGVKFNTNAAEYRFFEFRDGTTVSGRLSLNTSRQLVFGLTTGSTIATGTTVLSFDTWYYIEIKIYCHASSGAYEVKIDDVTELSGSGLNLVVTNPYVDRINLRTDSSSRRAMFDDVYVLDDSGTENTDFLGPATVSWFRPTSDSSIQWTRSSGSDSYALIDEDAVDGVTTRVSTSTSNALDMYGFEDYSDNQILAGLQANMWTSASGASMTLRCESGPSNTETSTIAGSGASYNPYSYIFETDPNTGVGWLKDDFNAATFGFRRISGTPGVSRFDIEILLYGVATTNIEVDADNLITFSQDAVATGTIGASASSVLALTSDATYTLDRAPISALADSALTLVDSATLTGEILVSASSVLSLVQTTSRGELESPGSAITFTQDVVLANRDFRRFLPAGMYNNSNVYVPGNVPVYPPDILRLIQSVAVQAPRRASASSLLTLSQTATVRYAIVQRSVSSLISFSDRLGRIASASASSALSLTDTAYRNLTAASVIPLTDTLSVAISRLTASQITFIQNLSYALERNRFVIQNDLALRQYVSYYLQRLSLECSYSPQVGQTSSGITPPSTTPPTLNTSSVLTLTYPAGSPTTTLVLRNPEFGNVHRLNFMRVQTESRGGTTILFADPNWPKEQTHSVQINALSRDQKDALVSFLAESVGREIGFADNEGRAWTGLILNPDCEITHVGRKNYSVSFEFEGELN